jgi:peptidoglycan/xylan/chitin deacetylase (PgdA/CDA1 family)
MHTQTKKIIYLALIIVAIVFGVKILFSKTNTFFLLIRNHTYTYGYSAPSNLKIKDVSLLPAAEAVPFIMYHGVIVKGDLGAGTENENTERKNFISQMEMLKREGYQTISVHEYNLFREGLLTLPPNPIVLTFDDGRKDSFYTVDEILKELDFKATLFVATGAAENNNFFLSWDELKKVKETGRWEIEAHGKHSHEEFAINAEGDKGMYLISRKYLPDTNTLESIEEYEERVEQDYIDGIEDLKVNLGITPQYYAVPLNDYGDLEISNVDNALEFNQNLTKKYFKLAFTQSGKFSFYNFKDTDPYQIKRLDIKNITGEELLVLLERFHPTVTSQTLISNESNENFIKKIIPLYGNIDTQDGVRFYSDFGRSARFIIGNNRWNNYQIKTEIIKKGGTSVSHILSYQDEDNFVEFLWTEKSLHLIENIDGEKTILAEKDLPNETQEASISLSIYNGYVTARFNNEAIAFSEPVILKRGYGGIDIWSQEQAELKIKSFEIIDLK